MRRLFPATVAVGLVLLAGCSGDDEPEPRISPTDSSSVASTPTASPTPTGPVEPTLPPAAEGEDAAAAEAFVRHFWEMVNYAQQTGDTGGLRALGLDSCQSCTAGAEWIERIQARGGRITGGTYKLRNFSTTALGAGDDRLFEVEVTLITNEQRIRGAGDLDGEFPAGRGRAKVTVLVSEGELIVADWEEA